MTGGAALSVFVATEHYNRQDEEQAARMLRGHLFSKHVQSSISLYFRETQPDVPLAFSGHAAGVTGRTRVLLEAGPDRYWFEVDVSARRVTAADAASQALIDRVLAYAIEARRKIMAPALYKKEQK